MKKYKNLIANVLYPLLAAGIVCGVWAIVAAAVDKPIIMPSLGAIAQKFVALFSSKGFWGAVGGTLLRALLSFVYSFVFAAALALLAIFVKPVFRLLSPLVTVLRAAPTMAIILLAMLWLDYDDAPVLIGFLVTFPLLYSAFYTAVSGVDKDLLEMARAFGIGGKDKIFKVYLPHIVPAAFDSLKSNVSLNLKVVIAAEVLSQTKKSIGVEMQRANIVFDVDVLLAWTVVAILLSFVAEGIFVLLKKLATDYRKKSHVETVDSVQNADGGETNENNA